MRLRTKLAAGAAASLTLTGLLAGMGGTASATTPTVTSVTISRSTVAVKNLNTLPVTWTVTIDNMARQPLQHVAWWYPRLVLRKVSGNGQVPQLAVSLCPSADTTLAACTADTGSHTNGNWTGTIQVPSTANGTWAVAGVWVSGPPQSPVVIPVPANSPQLVVTGVNPPGLSVGVSPNPVHYKTAFTFKGALYDTVTHQLLFGSVNVGTYLGLNNDECFNNNGHGTHFYYSRANGYAAPIPAAESNGPVHFCLDVLTFAQIGTPGQPGYKPAVTNSDGQRQEIFRRIVYPPTFTASGGRFPSTTPPLTARTGSTQIVNGESLPTAVSASNCQAYIQFLYGRTWRIDGAPARVRPSGYETLPFVVVHGRNLYRVYFPACGAGGAWLASSSRPVAFTGS